MSVREAIIVNSTPIAVPTATPYRKLTCRAHRPRIAMHTVIPANMTARPEVFSATETESSTLMPLSKFFRCLVTINRA